MATRLVEFINQEILPVDAARVAGDTPLLEGVIDSMGLMELIAFLEEEFEVEVDEADVTVERFRTVAEIERLVRRLLAEREAAT